MSDYITRIPPEISEAVKCGVTLQQLLKITGVRLRRGSDNIAEANCPFTSHAVRSPSFRIELSDPEHFWCAQCGTKGGIKEYLIALFCASDGNAQGEHELDIIFKPLLARLGGEILSQSDQIVSQVYKELLTRLPLYKEHAAFLSQRAISESDSLAKYFRSLPVDRKERVRISEELAAEAFNLEIVAGFFRLPEDLREAELRGKWCFGGDELGRRAFRGVQNGRMIRYEIGGIVIPIHDRFGAIRAVEVFNDKLPSNSPNTLCQLWPSQSQVLGYINGVEPKTVDNKGDLTIHYAFPEVQKAQILAVTEGALRAEILSALYGYVVIAVSDLAYQWEQVADAIRSFPMTILALSANRISDAKRLYNEALSKGQKAYIVDWNKLQNSSYEDCIFPPGS